MSGLSQHISQELKQTLRLSPVQIMFGRLLEMNTPEFEEAIDRALEENPALERVDDIEGSESPAAPTFKETADELQRADYGSDDEVPAYMLHSPLHDRDYERYDATSNAADDPVSVLEMQLADLDLSPLDQLLCKYVLGNLDSNGYLTRTAEAMADDLAMSEALEVTPAQIEHAIGIVRTLDPAGIGATNLRDCLSLQLERMSDRPGLEAARLIVSDYFNDFALNNIKRITEATGRSSDEIDRAFKLIKSLNPRPASGLEAVTGSDRLRQIVPDFIIDTDSDGVITATLAGTQPELQVSASFDLANADKASMAYIRERRESAENFINIARMRARTLMAVITTIISLQPAYFRSFDKADLRPMVLRDIAERTGLDISTISRAINQKYALTPFGTISLKSLFSEGVGSTGEVSAHNVIREIHSIINAENPEAPLSDAAIVEALKAKGIELARRTVAKYRELEGIPSTHYRKRKL